MFTRCNVTRTLFVSLLAAATAGAQPLEWSDDFLTATTYDSASLRAPCYGGPPTKYTMFEPVTSDVFNERAISGNGRIFITNRRATNGGNFTLLSRPLELTVIGWLGAGIGCPGEPSLFISSHPFTSPNLCVYGGFEFNHWQTRRFGEPGIHELFGEDGVPGVPGVDDDHDGTTDGTIGSVGVDDDEDGTIDEANEVPDEEESPARRPTEANDGYGYGPATAPENPSGTGFPAGDDDAPGTAGVDDDGNGTTDDIGETGWPGTDDGDDTAGLMEWTLWTRIDFNSELAVGLSLVPGEPNSGALFRLVENPPASLFLLERHISLDEQDPGSDDLVLGFYQPNTHYNFVYCTSGTCYGAQLWVETNMANPAETLGPLVSTYHTNPGPSANTVALANGVTRGSEEDTIRNAFTRHTTWGVNTNFSHAFWAVSGDPMLADFTNGIFGYPSPSSDLDSDRDVDGFDSLTFFACFNGALNPPNIGEGCTAINARDADLDGDDDVDGTDFLTFSNCFNNSNRRPSPFCFPPDLTTCVGASAMGGGGGLLAESAIQSDPYVFDGMSPTEDWYLYTPACTGDATLALCDSTGQSRSVDGIWFVFFDATAEEAVAVPATACGQGATQTVPVVSGQTVYLLVYPEAGAEALEGFTLDVTCGP